MLAPRASFRSRALAARLSSALLVAGVTLAASSCGSRTGLFGPDGLDLVDGASPASRDGSRDAALDVVPCVPGRFTLDVATAQLMFVFDRSGSMAFSLGGDNPVPFGEQSRWQVLHDALETTVLPLQNEIAMGAKFYPEPQADDATTQEACRTDTGVGIPPARGNVSAILDVFESTVPRGGTPTAEAVRLAAQFLTTQRSVARTIVLATDGAPNCNPDLDPSTCICTTPTFPCSANPSRGRYSCLDDRRTVEAIAEIAQTESIPVYVIGIGSTESPAFLRVLDEMAVAGGRPRPSVPRHYNVRSPEDLRSALVSIRDGVAKCTYLTPSSPMDPNAISVEVNGIPVPRDPTRQSGWDWVDQAYGTIAFFGAACTEASAGDARVSGVVSCNDG